TLCVDYRYKVEQTSKPLPLRLMKLRHSRKLWHFSHIASQCAAVAETNQKNGDFDTDFDGIVAERIGLPPLTRIAHSLDKLECPALGNRIFKSYDHFLGRAKDARV